jgi:FkbM family methyltransferase
MFQRKIKQSIQKLAQSLGYHILSKNSISGDMTLCLKGLKARGFSPKNILDVGANRAEWSEDTSNIFPESNYYLIEPQEELSEDLNKFFKTHKGAWFLGGAGAQSGELTLSIWDDLAGSSFLLPENEVENTGKLQRKVPIYTLNQLIADKKMPCPDLCKMDVQGFELEVLKGASTLFGKTEVFIIEASLFSFAPKQPILNEIIQFMFEKSYVIYDFPGFSNRPYDKALGQVDICFVKKDSFLRKSNAW